MKDFQEAAEPGVPWIRITFCAEAGPTLSMPTGLGGGPPSTSSSCVSGAPAQASAATAHASGHQDRLSGGNTC